MPIKKYILTICLTICTLTAMAQAKLVLEPSEWNFGSIREADGKVAHIFSAKNTGNKPIVILDIIASCGCTVPQYSRKPILPSQKTDIKVTFDPSNRPGTFVKELIVYSDEKKKVATITIRGDVQMRERSIEEIYPMSIGEGLLLTSNWCTFSYIYQDKLAQSSIGYANTSGKLLKLELTPRANSGFLKTVYAREIAKGERGEINLNYFIPQSSHRYGTVKDIFDISINGQTSTTPLVTTGIVVDNPDIVVDSDAPKAVLNQNTVKFGNVKHSGKPQTLAFGISNDGITPLIIRSVEIDGKISTTLRAGQKIAGGESHTATVSLDPKQQEYGILSAHINIITNDTSRPVRRLRVTAIIED